MKTPCDYGECPYDAYDGEACRVYCGLGVDVACSEDEYNDEECCGYTDDDFERAYESYYGTYDEEKSYGPSNPWDAPGMKISDFI